eukprot:6202027-Pleurochrysis_carterae.AAC.1
MRAQHPHAHLRVCTRSNDCAQPCRPPKPRQCAGLRAARLPATRALAFYAPAGPATHAPPRRTVAHATLVRNLAMLATLPSAKLFAYPCDDTIML